MSMKFLLQLKHTDALRLDHRNCSYELITEKHRSKTTTKKFVLKHTILYVYYVDILM